MWWDYLEKDLSNSGNTRKLVNITTLDMHIKHPTSYFACLYQVKSSLEVLNVADVMLEGKHLSQLYEFKNLQRLCVYPGILQNVQELYELMKHLPNLTDAQVFLSDATVKEVDNEAAAEENK